MLGTLKLLLPVLIPSWRFFDIIAPSPRIEVSLDNAPNWTEFRPRPEHLPVPTLLGRLLWNPHWNQTLFLMSCSERLMANTTDHSIREISTAIQDCLPPNTNQFRFRLVFAHRAASDLKKEVRYTSPAIRPAS